MPTAGLLRDMARVQREAQRLLDSPAVKMAEQWNRSIGRMWDSPTMQTALDAQKSATMSVAAASLEMRRSLDLPGLKLALENQESLRRAIALQSPALFAMQRMVESYARDFGPRVTAYAEEVGSALLDDSLLPSGDAEIDEDLADFVNLDLSETERMALYWLFVTSLSALTAGASALSEEASAAITTFVGIMMFFLALSRRRDKLTP